MTSDQAIERLVEDIQHVEGRPVTENDRDWIGWRVSKLHETVAEDKDRLRELNDRTDPVEEAFRTLAHRGDPLTHRDVLVMERSIRGFQSPESASAMLSERTLDELEATSVFNDHPELRESMRKAMAGPVLDFQTEVDDETVYCGWCDRDLEFTASELWLHNHRRHEEAMPDA